MKKLLALLLALACLLGLTACGREEVLEQPPELRVVSSGGEVTASTATTSWTYKKATGGYGGFEGCGVHPLRFEDLVPLTTTPRTVKLQFDVEPDSIIAEACWSDIYLGDNSSMEGEPFELNGNQVTLNSGGWIYEIEARWDRKDYNGSCRYVFHAVYDGGTTPSTDSGNSTGGGITVGIDGGEYWGLTGITPGMTYEEIQSRPSLSNTIKYALTDFCHKYQYGFHIMLYRNLDEQTAGDEPLDPDIPIEELMDKRIAYFDSQQEGEQVFILYLGERNEVSIRVEDPRFPDIDLAAVETAFCDLSIPDPVERVETAIHVLAAEIAKVTP